MLFGLCVCLCVCEGVNLCLVAKEWPKESYVHVGLYTYTMVGRIMDV